MKVQNYTRLFRQKGVASSDVYMYYSTRGDADSLATLVRQHYHGLLKWPPSGRLPRPFLPTHGLPGWPPYGRFAYILSIIAESQLVQVIPPTGSCPFFQE